MVAYEIDADADDDNVIEIFARLNQQGVRLRPGDLAAARLTGQMTNFRTRAREVLAMQELRGFSAPEGVEEGQPQRRLRRHRSADPRGAVPGRRRRALPRRREAQAPGALPEHRRQLGRRGRRVQERGRAVSQRRRPVAATGCPTATCCSRRRSRRRAATTWTNAGSGGRSRPACGATTPARSTPSWPRTPPWPNRATSTGLIEHVKLRAKRPDSAVPEEDDLLRNIVGEGRDPVRAARRTS